MTNTFGTVGSNDICKNNKNTTVDIFDNFLLLVACKISFSNSIKSYFNKWKVLYNNETKLWEYSEDLGATTLESAFSGTKDSAVSIPNGKGVELAWVT